MSEFKNKTEKDLIKTLQEKRNALQTFRFNISGSKTRNVKEARGLRKEVAQILTELNSQKSKKA